MIRQKGLLKDTLGVSLEEQLVMFLHTLGHNVRNRAIGSRFCRSGETVSRHFYRVLHVVCSLYKDYVTQPSATAPTPPQIKFNRRRWPYFKVKYF